MNTTPILQVEGKEMTFKIGKATNGTVNVFTDFNPIRKLQVVDMINDCDAVSQVFNVSHYEGTNTGGFALRLKKGKNEQDLQEAIEQILKTLLV